MTKAWCDNKECVYCQEGYCITGPELKNSGQYNNKGKPILVCYGAVKK